MSGKLSQVHTIVYHTILFNVLKYSTVFFNYVTTNRYEKMFPSLNPPPGEPGSPHRTA